MDTDWLLPDCFLACTCGLSCTLRVVVDCGSIMLDPSIATLLYDTYASHFEQYLSIEYRVDLIYVHPVPD
jgi:hypothetical protein